MTNKFKLIGMIKNRSNPLGAKNNDSHLEKWVIVKFYTMEYRKCGKSNSKNDSRPYMGASAFLKSVDFTAFAVNVKTIARGKYLYQFGHAIWWGDMPMPVYTFLEGVDLSEKTIIPFCPHGGSRFANTLKSISQIQPNAIISQNGFTISREDVADAENNIISWLHNLSL